MPSPAPSWVELGTDTIVAWIRNRRTTPFNLWRARRTQVDDTLVNLKTAREANGLDYILKQVLGDRLPDLDTLLTDLAEGVDLANTRARITDDLNLI